MHARPVTTAKGVQGNWPNDAIPRDRFPKDVWDGLQFWARNTPYEPALVIPVRRSPAGDDASLAGYASRTVSWAQLLVSLFFSSASSYSRN